MTTEYVTEGLDLYTSETSYISNPQDIVSGSSDMGYYPIRRIILTDQNGAEHDLIHKDNIYSKQSFNSTATISGGFNGVWRGSQCGDEWLYGTYELTLSGNNYQGFYGDWQVRYRYGSDILETDQRIEIWIQAFDSNKRLLIDERLGSISSGVKTASNYRVSGNFTTSSTTSGIYYVSMVLKSENDDAPVIRYYQVRDRYSGASYSGASYTSWHSFDGLSSGIAVVDKKSFSSGNIYSGSITSKTVTATIPEKRVREY